MAPYCPSTAEGVRVVAVPVPKADSSIGKVMAMIDANPSQDFTIEELAGRVKLHPLVVRASLTDLKARGLINSRPSRKRSGTQPVWLYRLAPDYSAHVRSVLKAAEKL